MRTWIGPVVALLAAGALLAGTLPEPPPRDPGAAGRPTLAQAWPGASRADLPGLTVEPLLFLDATTVVGTRASADAVHLVVVKGDAERELRRLPAADEPRFEGLTVAGGEMVWTEAAGDRPVEVWAVRREGGVPRRLTADTGNTLFYGNQYDLVVAGGRVHWAAGEGSATTEIRSVALTGGKVEIREERGQWALSAWPWLTDDTGNQSGTVRMRNMTTGQEVRAPVSGAEWAMCSPVWCRVMVMNGDGLARMDAMRPDGADRRRVAGPEAQAAVSDVAVLDRFEIFSEPGPESDVTGVAGLVVHDLTTGRTVNLAAAADLAATKDGMLWWSTGQQEAAVWHTLDLRTV
ncbi:hypothetical protein [Actinoplanes flavus]|uniref:Uncharacterized protein n=1 Tax=Actinoplanes flavus TaxID=2820290 RepID=A0ABS3UGR2_9ACTN|nr:hypothetical protein [Actinoplanes flavus]MBO3736953.1 hypothetical protein [Actinoplanes flavus]